MSSEFSLLQVSPTDLEQINSFLLKWDKEFDGESTNTFDLDGGMVEVLHFLLTGSFDTSGTWFSDSKVLVREVSVPNRGSLLLVDALAGGTYSRDLYQKGIVATCLDVVSVRNVAQALIRITQENLEERWDTLNQFASIERRRVIGSLERLQPTPDRLREVVWDIGEFTQFFINVFVAYYLDSADKGLGIVVWDCT